MLGIDSEILNDDQLSKLTAESHHLPLTTKYAHTTKHVSTLENNSTFTPNHYCPTTSNKKEKIQTLKKKLGEMEKCQLQMEQRLGGYVGVL